MTSEFRPSEKFGTHSISFCILITRLLRHWNVDVVLCREFDCAFIPGVGVPNNSHPWIGSEHALNAALCRIGAIRDDNHTGVLRVADANATAVVYRNP